MKKEYSSPTFHFVPRIGDSPGEEIAAMPDEALAEYLNRNRFAEQAKRYKANPDYLLREIAGEAILIPVGESAAKLNGMLSLNETFRFVWEQFQKPRTVYDVVLAAAERFEGTPDEMEKDINDYVRESVQRGFLIEEDE